MSLIWSEKICSVFETNRKKNIKFVTKNPQQNNFWLSSNTPLNFCVLFMNLDSRKLLSVQVIVFVPWCSQFFYANLSFFVDKWDAAGPAGDASTGHSQAGGGLGGRQRGRPAPWESEGTGKSGWKKERSNSPVSDMQIKRRISAAIASSFNRSCNFFLATWQTGSLGPRH